MPERAYVPYPDHGTKNTCHRIKPKGKTLAYSYARFSDKRQAAGDSITRQRTRAHAYAVANGLELTEIPADEGISAHHGRNSLTGHLADFIGKARSGTIPTGCTLLVENLDRLSRERIARAASLLLELVEDCGIDVVTLHNGKAYRRPMNLVDAIQALLEMDLAHQESVKKGERVKTAWQRARESGVILHNHNLAPGWLRKSTDGKWEVIPEKAALVVRIYEFLAAHDGGGMYRLASILNMEGVPPLNQHQATPAAGWHSSAIDKLRLNRAVLGEYTPGVVEFVNGRRVRRPVEQPRSGYFPAIITKELWLRAQRPRNTRAAGRPSLTTKNLFRGLLWSEVDGTKLIHRDHGERTKAGKSISYLVSGATVMKRSSHRVRYELFEERMMWFLRALKPDLLAAKLAVTNASAALTTTTLQAKLTHATRAHENLLKTLEIADDVTEIIPMIRERKSEIQRLKRQVDDVSRHETSVTIPLTYDLSTVEGREKARHQIAGLIDRIWVDQSGTQIRIEAPKWLDGLQADLLAGTFDFRLERAE